MYTGQHGEGEEPEESAPDRLSAYFTSLKYPRRIESPHVSPLSSTVERGKGRGLGGVGRRRRSQSQII